MVTLPISPFILVSFVAAGAVVYGMVRRSLAKKESEA